MVVTTTEKGTASHYLFQFFSLAENTYAYCIADDTSPYEERYNVFTITDTAIPTPADGEVNLDTGEYKYTIYANSSSSNLDPAGLTSLETGMAYVTTTETTPIEFDNSQTYVVFNG